MKVESRVILHRLIGAVVIVITVAVGLRISTGRIIFNPSVQPQPTLSGAVPPSLVNADDELASYLTGAKKNIKDGDYDRAIEVLQALIDKPNSGFVAASDGRQYVALWHRANDALASMGPEGLELYRRLYDAQAATLFKQASDTQNTASLRRLTQQFLHTSYGYRSLCRLGDIHFDRAQFARAAMYWRRALRLKTTPQQSAVLLAKIAASLHLSGDATASKAATAELTKKHKGSADVMGGTKQDLLAFVENVRKIPVPQISAKRHQADKEWSGLGAFPDGMAVMGKCDVVLSPSWRAPGDVPIGPVNISGKMVAMRSLLISYGSGYTMTPKPSKGHVYVTSSRRTGSSRSATGTGFFMPAGVQPVVAGNLVLCRLDNGVVAYDITTGAQSNGEPVWSTHSSELNRKNVAPARRYSSSTNQQVSDNGRHAMTVHGDLLYLTAKFTAKPVNRSGRMGAGQKQPANTSVLQALSISRQGRIMWQSDDRSVNSDEAVLGGKFISTPTICNGRIYSVMAFREMYHLVCMTADTGKLIWRVAVSEIPAMSSSYRMYNQHLLDRGSPVAVAEGVAFVATNAGVVAAFEAESGAAVWAYQYDSYINKVTSSRSGSMIQLLNQPSVNPIIVTRGKVITLPIDSPRLLMLSAMDGKPSGKMADRRACSDLSAIDSERVLLSGPNLAVVSIATGKEIHTASGLGIVGRPAVSSDSVLASGQGQLISLDLKDYSRSTRVFTNSDCLLGNLVCVDGKLIAANSSGVCVYLSYEDSIASLTKRIGRQDRPGRLNLVFNRGQLSFNSKRFKDALVDFNTAAADARKGGYSAIETQVAHWLYRTHVAMGNASGNSDDMQKHFALARQAAGVLGDDGAAQYILRCNMRLAKVMEARAVAYQAAAAAKLGAGDKKGAEAIEVKRHEALSEAVKLARKIAETYPDKRVPDIRIGAVADNSVRDTAETPLMAAGYWAQGRFIPKLIRDHGRKCYASFDEQAGDMLQKAIADNDSDAMLSVAKRWPNSLWANQAMYEGGTSLYVKARDNGGSDDYVAMSQAAAWMARAADTDDSMLKISALAGRATIYHGLGMKNYSRSLCRDIRKLCRVKGVTLSDTIEFAGGEKQIIDFLKKGEDGKPLPFEQTVAKISLKAPLDKAFTTTGEELFTVRDQEFRPVSQGANLLLIDAGKAVWLNTAAKSAEDAILWKSGAAVVQMDLIRNYMTAPGYGLIAGISGNGKIVAIADRGSRSATGFDIATGKVAWRGTFAQWGMKTASYMACSDGVMVVTDTSGLVACVEMNTGKIRWIGSRISGTNKTPVCPPQIERGVVMVTTNNYKKLTCYHAKGGKALGTWAAASYVNGRVTEGGMILVMVDGVVSIHDPARMDRPLWAKKYPSSSRPMVLASDTGRLFISQGYASPWIDVISMSDGRQLARIRCGSFTGSAAPVITGAVVRSGNLYVTFGAKLSGMRNRYFGRQTLVAGMGVQKIDIADGQVLWKNELGPSNYYYYSLPLIVSDNAIVVTCKDTQQTKPRHVHLLDSETGRVAQDIEVYKGVAGVMKQGDRVRLNAVLQPLLLKNRLIVETFEGVSVYKQK